MIFSFGWVIYSRFSPALIQAVCRGCTNLPLGALTNLVKLVATILFSRKPVVEALGKLSAIELPQSEHIHNNELNYFTGIKRNIRRN